MNSEKKQQWLDALRSGKYPQVTGALHTDDGFCCLGVYCDAVLGIPNSELDGLGGLVYEADASRRLFADIRWDARYRLSEMNDRGVSFKDIADYIKDNL